MSTTTPSVARTAQPGNTALVNWVKRHPLVAYFILAFAGAWLFIFPILLSQRASGLLTLPEPLLLILFLLSTFMGPAPAAFIVTGITDGKEGVKQLLRRMTQWRVGLGWYLLVIIGYPLVFLGGLLVALGPDPLTTLIQNWPLIFTAYLPLIPFGIIYPGLGEEPGWRGFALPRLQGMYGPLVASLVLGALHALWHLPVYFIPGAIADGGFDPIVFVANSLAIMASTFVWTWLFNSGKGSILFAMVVHATSNATSGFIPQLIHTDNNDPFFTFKLMTIVALLVIVVTRGRLAYKPPVALVMDGTVAPVPEPAPMPS
jgi:membrane protease YdiL (CAAX protease family)